MEKLFEGKTVFVTGGGTGIGQACAIAFRVRRRSRDPRRHRGAGRLPRLAEELGGAASFVKLDVTDPTSWAQALSIAKERFGPVNVLVNNAGIAGPFARTADLSPDAYHRILSVDQHGVVYGMHAAIPGMVEMGGGAIVNISSTAGFSHAGPPSIAYTAAKWAVRGISKAAAVEYAALESASIPSTLARCGPPWSPTPSTKLRRQRLLPATLWGVSRSQRKSLDWSCFWPPTMPLTSPARHSLPMEACSHVDIVAH